MTLIARLDTIASRQPEHVALQDPNGSYSWQLMMDTVERVAKLLKPYQSQVIGLYADNSADWVMMDLACIKAGVILLPLPAFFSGQQLQHALQSSEAVAVISDNVQQLSTLMTLTDKTSQLTEQMQIVNLPESDIQAAIPVGTSKVTFTSGSTGHPKGVCLSTENQLAVADALLERTQLQAPMHLCVLPLATLLENLAGVYAPLLSGGRVVLLPARQMGFNGGKGFDCAQFLKAISEQQPNSLILLPELLQALLISAESGWKVPDSLTFIAVGGSRVAPNLLSRAHQLGLPVYEGYGLSECSSVVALNTADAMKAGTVGKPLSHVEVNIVDNEIVVSGNAFLGYLNQPDSWETTQVRTGDNGFIDDDGYLHINGRIKNVLISSFGRNISPEWVESEILAHPAIQQCVVVGDAKPYCCALIQTRGPNIPDKMVDEWLDTVNRLLPDYAQVASWQRFVEPLSVEQGTLTANGRPVREKIYQKYDSQIDDLYKETA